MDLVLLTFGLIFAAIRLFGHTSDERIAKGRISKYGSQSEFYAMRCDEDMELMYKQMVNDRDQFVHVWEMLEKTWTERNQEIMSGPERDRDIWIMLMKDGRVPFYDYVMACGLLFDDTPPEFVEYFKKLGIYSDDQVNANKMRAVHCLMWAHGKTIKRSAAHEWDAAINWTHDPKQDYIRYFDGAKKKEESDRRRALEHW